MLKIEPNIDDFKLREIGFRYFGYENDYEEDSHGIDNRCCRVWDLEFAFLASTRGINCMENQLVFHQVEITSDTNTVVNVAKDARDKDTDARVKDTDARDKDARDARDPLECRFCLNCVRYIDADEFLQKRSYKNICPRCKETCYTHCACGRVQKTKNYSAKYPHDDLNKGICSSRFGQKDEKALKKFCDENAQWLKHYFQIPKSCRRQVRIQYLSQKLTGSVMKRNQKEIQSLIEPQMKERSSSPSVKISPNPNVNPKKKEDLNRKWNILKINECEVHILQRCLDWEVALQESIQRLGLTNTSNYFFFHGEGSQDIVSKFEFPSYVYNVFNNEFRRLAGQSEQEILYDCKRDQVFRKFKYSKSYIPDQSMQSKKVQSIEHDFQTHVDPHDGDIVLVVNGINHASILESVTTKKRKILIVILDPTSVAIVKNLTSILTSHKRKNSNAEADRMQKIRRVANHCTPLPERNIC